MIEWFNLAKIPVEEGKADPDIDDVNKWLEFLNSAKAGFKDPKVEQRINEMMKNIFDSSADLIQSIVDNNLKSDPSFSVGVLIHTEYYMQKYKSTFNNYLNNFLETLNKKLMNIFDKFIAEQIKFIPDINTNTKIKGLLPFIKGFPRLLDRFEKLLSDWTGQIRLLVDKSYQKILKKIFETLEGEIIKLEMEEKTNNSNSEENLMYLQILVVENMWFFTAELRARKISGLEKFVKQSKTLYDINMSAYCKACLRKPLGRLMEFFEGIENLLKTGSADEVSYHQQYSKNSLKNVVSKYPGKEVFLKTYKDQKRIRKLI